MKRLTFILSFIIFCGITLLATPSIITFEVTIDDKTETGPGHTRPSVSVPEVSIEGYTLFFGTPCDGSILRLLDEDGFVVYSTVIPTGTTTLPLPTMLSGEYELQIIQDGWCFYGWIEL